MFCPTRRVDGASKPTPDGCTGSAQARQMQQQPVVPALPLGPAHAPCCQPLSTCQAAHTPPPIGLRPCRSMGSLAPLHFRVRHAADLGRRIVGRRVGAPRRGLPTLVGLHWRVTDVTKKKSSVGREKTITRGAPRARGERAASEGPETPPPRDLHRGRDPGDGHRGL